MRRRNRIKVAFRDWAGHSEHMWLDNIERKDSGFSGVLTSDPVLVKGMRRGQRNEFQENQITDWTYMRFGKIVGSYTMRPLLKRMPPEEAARYRAMLADP